MDINPQMGGTTEPTPSFIDEPISESISSSTFDSEAIKGLSEEELNDPNEINITISDLNTPIVVLFGPPACGKTMTLVRLTRYQRKINLRVVPVENFRPSTDRHYKEMCDEFSKMVNSDQAASSTQNISFMLVRVLDESGRPICQILEAPGEYYYNPNNDKEPNVEFPRYVNAIKNSTNRKIWCYIVEPKWNAGQHALNYVEKIKKLKSNMRAADKAIFVMNKADLTPFVYAPGQINKAQAEREISNLYPGIFVPFIKKGILGSSKNYKFVPFHTGDYNSLQNGGYSFQEGPDEYPRELWQTIFKLVKG